MLNKILGVWVKDSIQETALARFGLWNMCQGTLVAALIISFRIPESVHGWTERTVMILALLYTVHLGWKREDQLKFMLEVKEKH